METAVDAVRAAGVALREAGLAEPSVVARPAHDVKLNADISCEKAIIGRIRERFPADSILSEEAGLLPGKGERTWVVDPLDGSVNFSHGLPLHCTSVACVSCGPERLSADWDSRLEAAAVLIHPLNELYTATRSGGALLNGASLNLARRVNLADALVSVGVSVRDGNLLSSLRLMGTFAAEAQKVRALGFLAGELAFLSAGRIDALVMPSTNLWDFCAAALLVREAGGKLDAMETTPGRWRIVASNPGLHESVMGFVERI